jgi:hypothetical protein
MTEYIGKRRKVIIFAAAVMAITMIPYLLGYMNQGEGWRFSGFVIGVEDGNSYLAKMLSGSTGSWLFRSPHSAVEQNGVIAYLPYILLGKLASGSAQHEQLVVLYHLARFVFGALAILATYDFAAVYIKSENLRWWVLVFITFGGGLGWILVSINQKGYLGSLPLEFISPESFGFLALFGFPHLAAARAFLLWGLTAFLKNEAGYISGVFWLATGFFQPMVVVIAWAIIGSYAMLQILTNTFVAKNLIEIDSDSIKRMILRSFQALLISCPIVIYTAYIFLRDPYFKAWTIQNRFPSPHLFHYLVAYGLVLPLAIAGIIKFIKSQQRESLMLAGWLLISPFLIYAPVITQRRLAEGLWVVLIIGLMGNYFVAGKIPKLVQGALLLTLPSTLFIIAGSILRTYNPSEPVFRKLEEVKAYEFIAANAEKDSIVLSTFEIGNNLPAWAPVRVVMGHGPETIGLGKIQSDLAGYFKNSNFDNSECIDFFETYDIDYLLWGPLEKIQWQAKPEEFDCLEEIYNNDGFSVYQVN